MENHSNNNSNLKKIVFNTILFCFALLICLLIYIIFISRDLPSLDELQKFNPDQVSKIISSDGEVVKKLYIAKRDMVSISLIPKNLRYALLSMEDRDFYNHNGINIKGIIRAVIIDVINLSGKSILTNSFTLYAISLVKPEETSVSKLYSEKWIKADIFFTFWKP